MPGIRKVTGGFSGNAHDRRKARRFWERNKFMSAPPTERQIRGTTITGIVFDEAQALSDPHENRSGKSWLAALFMGEWPKEKP